MKNLNLTKKDIEDIMELHRNGVYQNDIAEKYHVSQSFISILIKSYNGNKNTYLKLAESHKSIIDELTKNKYNTSKHCIYECKILWGLITLKFKPLTNN